MRSPAAVALKFILSSYVVGIVTALCLTGMPGCGPEVQEPKLLLPPAYNRGDLVTIAQEGVNVEAVGIITKCERLKDNTWQYVVMFKDEDIQYHQDLLKLVERFDWSRKGYVPNIKAEIGS